MAKQICLYQKLFIVFVAISLFLGSTQPSFAQCESEMIANAQSAVEKAITAATKAASAALGAALALQITTTRPLAVGGGEIEKLAVDAAGGDPGMSTSLDGMEKHIIARLDEFWTMWDLELKKMTQQLSATPLADTQQEARMADGNAIASVALELQKAQLESRKKYKPNDQGCAVDTATRALGKTTAVRKAIANVYANDFSDIGNNKEGSPSAGGPAAFAKYRWKKYVDDYCDAEANGGVTGCTGLAQSEYTNAHVSPSKTIFLKETIDMKDPKKWDAVKELLFNITDYEATDPQIATAQKSAEGLNQRRKNREYLTQMDALGALIFSVVSSRAPGEESTEIQDVRVKAGFTEASATPSAREIRQAFLEQLWDPKYYRDLYDVPATISQKEIYLKAYSLNLLHEMITKQEKISNIYAIETSNLLNRVDNSRRNATSQMPLK